MIKLNLKTSIAGKDFEHPIFNASGPKCITREELEEIGVSRSAGIMAKSCTIKPRDGNPSPRHFDFCGGAIGSYGLPNLGYKKYLEIFPQLKSYCKPIIASVSGMSIEENQTIISEFSKVSEIDLIELNISCPNIIGKPQVGYDFDYSKKMIAEIGKVCKKPLGLKLPPYFDFAHFNTMAKIINNSKVSFVTCINSVGNGLYVDFENECTVIKPKKGFGGVGGIIKPFGLANVRKFRELLRDDINIVGVGGIFTGKDVFEYLLCGADAVQIGTAFMQSNTQIFEKLLLEFKQVIQDKEYTRLSQFKNKLKEI
ncbi:MAG: dihydroorotate oxidase [Candidatus Diapherotrites archaeon]|jgi:dihydroorotate dehydrogenase (fumarate)|nr:dihydroorotate oxidase [Candidatus Diapherotrites archaeon]MBT4597094.1 dihydroorotate oxidase [Candidatus Diapherotrites archaeon]